MKKVGAPLARAALLAAAVTAAWVIVRYGWGAPGLAPVLPQEAAGWPLSQPERGLVTGLGEVEARLCLVLDAAWFAGSAWLAVGAVGLIRWAVRSRGVNPPAPAV